MSEARRAALVLGGTGLVGGHLLDLLLRDPAYGRVAALGRRPVAGASPRLEQRVVELERMEEHAGAFAVDDVFCALGTTLRAAGSRAAFRRVDRDHVVEAARLAARAGSRRFLLVSAAGSSPRSPFFYSRVKAAAEAGVVAQPLPGVAIFRPAQLLGDRGGRRPLEAAAQRVTGALAPLMVGPLRRMRGVPARTVARAMLRVALSGEEGPPVRVVENEEILDLGAGGDG
jgi:uncharacterized protein YbjT (DUF2867 family)